MAGHLDLAGSLLATDTLPVQAPVRVILADDDELMRRSLRHLLDNADGIAVVAVVRDVAAAVRRIHEYRPDVLVLDLRLHSGSAFAALHELRAQVPETEIVVVTMEDGPEFARQALDSGAVGFVLKDFADTELPEAVRAAARGAKFVSPRVIATVATIRPSLAHDTPTTRELEVLQLIALGHASTEIAGKLHRSQRTIETDRANLYRKLGLRTRAELVRYVLEHGALMD